MKKREIPALLRPKIMDLDYSVLAEVVRQQGRGRDKVLAHITPDEARLLKSRGGRGSINPQTGLPEFQEDDYYSFEGDESFAPSPADTGWNSGFDLPQMDMQTAAGAVQPTSFDVGEGQIPSEIYAQQFSVQQPQIPALLQAPPNNGWVSGYDLPQMDARTEAGQVQPTSFDVGPGQIPSDVYARFLSNVPQAAAGGKGGKTEEERKKEESGFNWNNLLRALGIGGTALLGARQARQAGQQAPMLRRELQDVGAPYRAMGQERIAAGQTGQLTAGQQQALQAMRAQGRQQLARAGIRGSTAAMQLEGAVQRQADVFAQQNIDQGIKLLNIADNYTVQGIRAAYQADADARNLAQRFFAATTQMIPQSQPGAVRTVPTAP